MVLGVTLFNSFGSVFGKDDSALEGYIYTRMVGKHNEEMSST
jgi:hypothetical protein